MVTTVIGDWSEFIDQINAVNLIGASNQEWVNLQPNGQVGGDGAVYEFNFASSTSNYFQSLSTSWMNFSLVGVPLVKGGLNLYVAGVRMAIRVADGSDYVTTTNIVGHNYNTSVELDSNTNDLNSAGISEDTFTGIQVGGVYSSLSVLMQTVFATITEFQWLSVEILIYYI